MLAPVSAVGVAAGRGRASISTERASACGGCSKAHVRRPAAPPSAPSTDRRVTAVSEGMCFSLTTRGRWIQPQEKRLRDFEQSKCELCHIVKGWSRSGLHRVRG